MEKDLISLEVITEALKSCEVQVEGSIQYNPNDFARRIYNFSEYAASVAEIRRLILGFNKNEFKFIMLLVMDRTYTNLTTSNVGISKEDAQRTDREFDLRRNPKGLDRPRIVTYHLLSERVGKRIDAEIFTSIFPEGTFLLPIFDKST